MEIESKKNKTCAVPDGTSIIVPFQQIGQIDLTSILIEDAIKKGVIVKAGPYYKIAGRSFLGMTALRNFFIEEPNELALLESSVQTSNS
jgi:hypothetical protein